jgi:hypothetical protein
MQRRGPPQHRWRKHWELVRDILLFGAGLSGIFYQLLTNVANPSLLIVFAGMLGLPITLASVRK